MDDPKRQSLDNDMINEKKMNFSNSYNAVIIACGHSLPLALESRSPDVPACALVYHFVRWATQARVKTRKKFH